MQRDGAELTHIDPKGRLRMVDVSEKAITAREAKAEAVLYVEMVCPRGLCSVGVSCY